MNSSTRVCHDVKPDLIPAPNMLSVNLVGRSEKKHGSTSHKFLVSSQHGKQTAHRVRRSNVTAEDRVQAVRMQKNFCFAPPGAVLLANSVLSRWHHAATTQLCKRATSCPRHHQCRGHKTDYGAFLLVAQLGNCVDPNPCNETVCS